MKPTDKILIAINEFAKVLPAISQRHAAIAARIPGWSGAYHRLFFQSALGALPIKSVLILGVYLGRDIATMLDLTTDRGLQVVGVDKFADAPCDDWPEAKRNLTWEAAGFGKAPNAEQALTNINPLPPHMVRLIEADDAVWLPTIKGKFDLIYVDTSHDKATCLRQFAQIRPLCHETTVVAGDDYENLEPTWGVKDAVTEAFATHRVLAKTIWFADAEDYK